jgi:8-hydroxy-5-deazaflavin:NADPH oxidoreductase
LRHLQSLIETGKVVKEEITMKVAIIGTGNVGIALAGSLKRAGHEVTLAARDAAKAGEKALELGVEAAATPAEASRDAQSVILAVPGDEVESVARAVTAWGSEPVLIDVTNRMQPDLTAESNAERLQRVTSAPVVKAFNTVFASRMADPSLGGVAADGYVASDDPVAKEQVLALVRSVGFRPVDAGPLSAARVLEGMAWLNISRNLQGGSWQSAWAIVEPGQLTRQEARN